MYSCVMTTRDEGDVVPCNAATGSSVVYKIYDRVDNNASIPYYNKIMWVCMGT